MDRWNWVAVRAYGLAAFTLLVAVASVAVLSQWQASPLRVRFVGVGRGVLLALAAALWLAAAPTHRLVQWLRCQELDCPRCNGPLGHERTSYASRGGAYRRCHACGDNVNHRHYE